MRVLTALLLVSVALAGCADDGPSTTEEETTSIDDDLKATKDTGVIRGVVVDSSITPVAGAIVKIKALELEATTNEEGLFGFSDLDPGNYFLDVTKAGYTKVQASASVEAGVDKPDIVRVQIEIVPGAQPLIDPLKFNGYLTCGAAIFATSVGCTTFPLVAQQIGDQSVFYQPFTNQPNHVQAELVWESTQAAAGMLIWEITPGGNTHIGYRETTYSPALAYLDNSTIEANKDGIMDDNGVAFRFFGGPHELCTGIYGFGCGVTLDQSTTAFVHVFYNVPFQEGWRFTEDGDHPLP